MQKPQKRLGRGLNALISMPEVQDVPEREIESSGKPSGFQIRVDQIRPNPYQPRKDIEPEELRALANSIKQSGVIQPIILRQKSEKLYELIAGERRWRASQLAGLTEIPAVVREADDRKMLEIALAENIFREDLNPIERAEAYLRYSQEFEMSAEEIAASLGEDRSTVSNYIRLMDLPNDVKLWVAEGKLAMGHARCLLAIKSPSDLAKLAQLAISQGLSVRALEKLVRDRVAARDQASQPAAIAKNVKRPQIRSLEETFVRSLGTKVEISESRKKGSGKITIHYFNLDDFDRIAQRLGVDDE